MPITRETLAILADLRATLGDTLDAHTRDLVEMYAVGWDEVADELAAAVDDLVLSAQGGRVTRTQVLRSERARRSLEVLGRQLREVTEQAGIRVTGDIDDVLRAATEGHVGLIASQLPASYRTFSRVSPEAKAMARRTTQRIVSKNRRLIREADAAMRRELMRGIAVGDNPRTAARRMLRGVEDAWDGGLNRAMVIARTEMIDAHRAAGLAVDKANADVLEGWVWLCALGPRACAACVGKHGSVHEVNEPGPQGHPQCQCSRGPRVKSWEDLGFKGVKEPRDVLPDGDAFVSSLSDKQLGDMLGKDGAAAFKRGDWPREKWARLRHNDGWRDDWVPAKPPRPNA